MQESREWEGKLFSRTRNNALIFEEYLSLFSAFVDIILYYITYVCICYFQTRVLNFWRDFFFYLLHDKNVKRIE